MLFIESRKYDNIVRAREPHPVASHRIASRLAVPRAACGKVLIANKELQVIIQHNLARSTAAAAVAAATTTGPGKIGKNGLGKFI